MLSNCWVESGGCGWSRTNIVYPVGVDLQSTDAHAIASTQPLKGCMYFSLNFGYSECEALTNSYIQHYF